MLLKPIRGAVMKLKPRMGIVYTSIEGIDADQEKLGVFRSIFNARIMSADIESHVIDFLVSNEREAARANLIIKSQELDLLCIVAAIWTPDTTVLRLIEGLDFPLIVFTTTLSPYTIGLNGAQIIAASLKEMDIEYRFIFGNIEEDDTLKKVSDFAAACAVAGKISCLRVGVVGGRPVIMSNLAIDEFGLKKILGTTVVPIDFSRLEEFLEGVDKKRIKDRMNNIKGQVKNIKVQDPVLEESVKYFLAFSDIVKQHELDAISFNCYPFPYIKAKTCLAASNLNDAGIPAACESDIHSAILMYILKSITGTSSLNSDLVYEDAGENAIIFSHCGCGPFSCADKPSDIRLEEHFEVKSGMAVYYPLKIAGRETTIVNMVGREGTLRLCVLSGNTIPTKKLDYAGNPVTVRFQTDIKELINIIGNEGFGHHWMVSFGNHSSIFEDFCELKQIKGVFIE